MPGIITVEQVVSADGFAAGPDDDLSFHSLVDDPADDADQLDWLRSVDSIWLGRRTYELFAAHWPEADPADQPVAAVIDRLPKHVLSSTLDRAPWGSTEIEVLRGTAVAAAQDLRSRYASTVVWGSLTLTEELLEAGVVDVLRLRVAPVLLGAGRRFAPSTTSPVPLALTGVTSRAGGTVTLEYARRS